MTEPTNQPTESQVQQNTELDLDDDQPLERQQPQCDGEVCEVCQ